MTIVKIRKGLNGFPYSICTEKGYFIFNVESIEEVKEFYQYEIKHKSLKLVKELKLYPNGEEPIEKVNMKIHQNDAKT